MATKTFYILNTLASGAGWFSQLQDGGTAPTAATCAYGWAPGKLSGTASNFCRARLGASGTVTTGGSSILATSTGPQAGTGTTNATSGDAFITPSTYTGSFLAGNWTFVINLIATTAGMTGQLGIKIWASTNASGSGARQLSSGVVYFPTAGGIAVNTTATAFNYTWAAPLITLNNEYLFFEIEWKETTTGTQNADNAFFRAGSTIVTTNFAQVLNANLGGTGGMQGTTVGSYISSGRQLQYLFDDLTGADISGNNNTGTIQGTGTTLVTGQTGNALSFDGNGYVSFTDVSLLGIPTGTSEYTACAWIKTPAATAAVFELRDATSSILHFGLGWNGASGNAGTPSILLRSASGAEGAQPLVSTTTVNDNNWHHIAYTRNSSKLDTIYIDGVFDCSATDTISSAVTPTLANANIGKDVLNGAITPIVGVLDDVRIYNRALTSTEINQIATLSEVTALAAPDLTIPPAGPRTYQLTALWPGAGAASWASIDPVDLYMQHTALLTGAGGARWTTIDAIDQLLVAAATLAGAGGLVADIRRFVTLSSTLTPVGSLSAQTQMLMPATATAAGVGAASATTSVVLAASIVLAGAGTQASALRTLLATSGTLAGAGIASAAAAQQMAAPAALAGSGAFAPLPDVTRQVAAGTVWTIPAGELPPWPAVGALAAQASQWLVASATAMPGTGTLAAQAKIGLAASIGLAGAGTLTSTAALGLSSSATFSGAGTASWPTVDPIDQLLAATAALAGAGSSTSSLLTLRPISAALSGLSTQLASVTARMSAAATLAGSATQASSLSQALSSNATWAGASGALGSLAQQLSASAPFTGAGSLASDAPALRAASTALAGSGLLNAASAQLLASVAALGGAGLLTATQVQWQNIVALAPGTSTLTGDVFVPGHNLWSAILNVWPAAGSLAATATARLVATSNLAAASTLAGSLTARGPVSMAAAGAGQLASVASSLQLVTSASYSGAGTVAANYYQSIAINSSILNGLGSLAATQTTQRMFSTSALSGSGALVGDVAKLTGGQIQQIDAVTYLGLSALTAQARQLLQGLTAWSGAGALTPLSVTLFKPLSLSPAGQGLLAASAAQQMLAVSAAAGAGSLVGDVQRFIPGIQQGSAVLAGAGSLLLATQQLLTTQVVFLGSGSLTAPIAHRMALGSVWPGSGVFLATLTQTFPLASLWSGQGLLGADVARLTLVPQLASQLAGLGSLAMALRSLQAGLGAFPGAGAMTTRVVDLMALQALAGAQGSMLIGLSQHEKVAAALAASGYGSQWLGQIQHFDQSTLVGNGALAGNIIQTSIRVLTATITGRSSQGKDIQGQLPGQGLVGQPTTQRGVTGQGDFVTLH